MPLARLDLALQAGLTHFGGPVNYQPTAGAPFTVDGVFSAAHQDVEIGAESVISSVSPRLGVRLADFAAPPRPGDKLTRGAVTYRVDDVQDDGEGGASLMLHRF